MKFSAPKARRKWPCAGSLFAKRLTALAMAELLIVVAPAALAAQKLGVSAREPPNALAAGRVVPAVMVPLPKPRPSQAPGAAASPENSDRPAEVGASAPPLPSACQR